MTDVRPLTATSLARVVRLKCCPWRRVRRSDVDSLLTHIAEACLLTFHAKTLKKEKKEKKKKSEPAVDLTQYSEGQSVKAKVRLYY